MLPSNSLRIASFITREFCFFLLYQKEVPSPVFLFSGLHLPLPCVGFLFLPLHPCFASPTSTLVSSGVSFSLCFPGQVVKCTNLSHLFFFFNWSSIDLQYCANLLYSKETWFYTYIQCGETANWPRWRWSGHLAQASRPSLGKYVVM